jgi:hypothetical protein
MVLDRSAFALWMRDNDNAEKIDMERNLVSPPQLCRDDDTRIYVLGYQHLSQYELVTYQVRERVCTTDPVF